MAFGATSYFPAVAAVDQVSGGFTAGRVIFASDSDTLDDDGAHYWDDVNKRLGIGTTSPAKQIHAFSASADVEIIAESQNNYAAYQLKNASGSQAYIYKHVSSALGGLGNALEFSNNSGIFQFSGSQFVNMSGVFVHNSTTAGITASTTQTQGQGALTSEVNEIATCANANDTVTLPAAIVGRRCEVFNNGAMLLKIFPAAGDDLGLGANTATTLAPGLTVVFRAYDATNWRVV